jgi:ubiquinone/menaquinone biosynthesis C-methylase UbiE
MAIQPGETLLDLGCGPGELWVSQRKNLPENCQVILCDFSTGMVKTAASNLPGETPFSFSAGDAQAIPLRDQSCDLVTANHMLYHVPNIDLAVREIKRVLKKGGRLVAATNGEAHLKELYELVRSFIPGYTHETAGKRFGLETGAAYLRPYFDEVEVKIYPDNLWVTEVQPLMDYIDSMWSIWGLEELRKQLEEKFQERIQAEIQKKGGFFIQKSGGVFLAR